MPGEAQQSGGSPSWKGAEKRSNHSTVPMICRLWAVKWRQSHGVIAQCNSADQLAQPYRSAVSAVDLGGQTHTDVAHAVGISTSGMKSRVQRGRRQLRQLLTDCCRVHTSPTGSISGYEPLTGGSVALSRPGAG
jgi:hypothetical protein